MLSHSEMERRANQLADFRSRDALTQILDDYAALLEEHKRLQSDYEEERDAREKYKQMAKGQERNSFALVLVDGDGYIFNDNMVSKRAEGGVVAAQMLNDAVRASLVKKGLGDCQIMVRVYANVHGLSKALAKINVAGAESRSLAPFIASFNRAYGLTEFVDAGQLKENADFKLRAMLRLYAENVQCKHIYFAACHDVGYISELASFAGNTAKFTLVNSPGVRFHDEFNKLGLGIEGFPGVFRPNPLDVNSFVARPLSTPAGSKAAATVLPLPSKKVSSTGAAATVNGSSESRVCPFYSMGKCRFGKACKNLHADPLRNSSGEAKRSADRSPEPAALSLVEGGGALISGRASPASVPGDLSGLKGFRALTAEGFIPVNRNGYRLDPYLAPIDASLVNRLKARCDAKRVCNAFHLNNHCDAGDNCEYDHEPLDEELLPALEALARTQPCPRRGECRHPRCTHGHICQNLECKHRGGKVYCRIPHPAHLEPLDLHEMLDMRHKIKPATKQPVVSF